MLGRRDLLRKPDLRDHGATMLVPPLMLLAAAAAPAPGPSFDCARAATAVERLICGDERLAAYDRAVALLYASARRGKGRAAAVREQCEWLESRARCADVPCLIESYQVQLNQLGNAATGWGTAFSSRSNNGTLEIAPLGGGWSVVSINALWFYPSGKDANMGGISEIVRIRDGHAVMGEEQCRVSLDAAGPSAWRVRELRGPDHPCGGMNVTLDGTYRRSR
jgi:uncharacterized protein